MTTLLYHVAHDLFHVCSLGMSGVVFGLIALVTKFLKSDKCTFGCFCLPYNVVPWCCVILYFAAFHRGSVFMHIGGIVAGYARIFLFFSHSDSCYSTNYKQKFKYFQLKFALFL